MRYVLGVAKPKTKLSRAEQRAETEERVLRVARELFGEQGYDRTTIRAVAARAEVDPSLVMQYFGSKEELFTRVAAGRWPVHELERAELDRFGLLDALLDLFTGRAADEEELAGVKAMLRSSLTNPDAAAATRKVLFEGAAQRLLAPVVDGEDAAMRAELVASMLLGVVVARAFLGVEPLASAKLSNLRPYLRRALITVLEAPPSLRAATKRRRQGTAAGEGIQRPGAGSSKR